MILGLGVSTWANTARAQSAGAGAHLLKGAPPLAQIQRGREMFMRRWTAGDSHTPTGDGLGPMFNARSCADCHSLGGLGGAGRKENNVDLLSIILPADKEKLDLKAFRDGITGFHPAFTSGTGSVFRFITLHKFSTNPAYDEWLTLLKPFAEDSAADDGPPVKKPFVTRNRIASAHSSKAKPLETANASRKKAIPGGVKFQLTHRNTPALFGAAVIDTIPDDVIRRAAADQAKLHTPVNGQVALSGTGGVGKFGWRGQTATLKAFVMGACANELGLEVPTQTQPIDPLDPTHKSPGLDVTQEQCDDLTAFVASLPSPTPREPSSAREAERLSVGKRLFSTTGCAVCHMESLGGATGIYSDLLLHDMGTPLADPAPANSSGGVGRGPASSGAGYYGGSRSNDIFVGVPPVTLRQWRTPPLWGVADSAPYLHDGRAATLHDAIMAHGGEANGARMRYVALPASERGRLLAFLNDLTVSP